MAVAILSLGITVVLRSFVSSLRAVQVAQRHLLANLLMEEKIWARSEENLRQGGIEADQALEEGSFAAPFEDYEYKVSFEEEGPQGLEDQAPLYKSSFEVSWQQRAGTHSLSCVTYFRSKD